MSAVGTKLRRTENRLSFWCPGCKAAHTIRVDAFDSPSWKWDGNVEAPTFAPSVLITTGHYVPRHKPGDACWCTFNAEQAAKGDRTASFGCGRCHLFVRAGRIEFLTDCTHALAGQVVDLPTWPSGSDQ